MIFFVLKGGAMRKGLCLILACMLLVGPGGAYVHAQDAGQKKGGEVKGGESETPEWLKRTRFNIEAGTDIEPKFYFETVQPIYRDMQDQNTFFVQPRYSFSDQDSTYNIGVGYRRLLKDNNILLGMNTFWDAHADHDHFRVGVGGEAFLSIVELRSNAYFALSPRRQVDETASFVFYEKAVDGFDVEGGIPLPYVNWISVYGSYFFYDYEKGKDNTGWKVRTNIKPNEYSFVNLSILNGTKTDETEFRVDGGVVIPFDVFWGEFDAEDLMGIGISSEPYPEVDHGDRTLDRVERNYNIEIEKWAVDKTTNAVISIRRGL